MLDFGPTIRVRASVSDFGPTIRIRASVLDFGPTIRIRASDLFLYNSQILNNISYCLVAQGYKSKRTWSSQFAFLAELKRSQQVDPDCTAG